MLNDLVAEDDVDQIEDQEDDGEHDFDHEVMTEQQFNKLMEHWKQEAGQLGGQQMMDEWNRVWDEEATMGMMGPTEVI